MSPCIECDIGSRASCPHAVMCDGMLLRMHVCPAMRLPGAVQVCQELIETSVSHPWQDLYQQVRSRTHGTACSRAHGTLSQMIAHPEHADASLQGQTRFLQKRECCAGALEGQLIATLCRLRGAKTVLEVGMFTGTTTLAVAQTLPDDGKVGMAAHMHVRGRSHLA